MQLGWLGEKLMLLPSPTRIRLKPFLEDAKGATASLQEVFVGETVPLNFTPQHHAGDWKNLDFQERRPRMDSYSRLQQTPLANKKEGICG
jgi:hypothetical protein